jgi:predicted metal-dependent HD superfamily phosphohydrolase
MCRRRNGRERRAAILRGFLLRGPLFATRFFRERYESRARSNLARAFSILTADAGRNEA